jgi:hypothetical protein
MSTQTPLKKAITGLLAGFTYVPIDLMEFANFKQKAYDAHVGYVFGGKDPNLGSGTIGFSGIDCSGWFRTLADYSTHGILQSAGLPDGSYTQAQWLIDQGFKHHVINSSQQYNDAATISPTDPSYNLLRVCFHYPNGRGGDNTGHVWMDTHDHSVESYGGHGPGEEHITASWFEEHCDLVVVLGPLLSNTDFSYPVSGY